MNKKELKELNKNVSKMVKELKNAGIKDSTIELIIKDIQEYQEQLIIKQFLETKEKISQMLVGEDNESN